MLKSVSNFIARAEVVVAASLAGAITLLILLNIVSRTVGYAIYWVDELAIYCMVWMTFFITSALLKKRQAVAVTLLTDRFSGTFRYCLDLFSDLMVLLFALLMFWLCWRWFDPIALYQAGFDPLTFQADTFNFIYSENTNTLDLKKFWIWLALPVFSFSLLLHALSNLLDNLRPVANQMGEAG